jgi:hypothetical protein
MNKAVEIVLTALALVGLFSALPKSAPANVEIQTQHTVVVADGSDPMPICRGKRCF